MPIHVFADVLIDHPKQENSRRGNEEQQQQCHASERHGYDYVLFARCRVGLRIGAGAQLTCSRFRFLLCRLHIGRRGEQCVQAS